MTTEIAAPKPDPSAKAKKTTLKHFLKGILKGKSPAHKLRKSVTNHYRNLDAATPVRFTTLSCSAASLGLPACIYAHGHRT